jgi:SAM-dependent methyltransferase
METQTQAETAVKERYGQAALAQEPQLCCPVDYDPQYLAIIPEEVLAKDYGCGDPSKYLNPGETVLDLGSGTGKICFIASQVVGATGKVIGIDMTAEMLEVARRNAPQVAERAGFANVEFRRGLIQDLALDLDALDDELAANPITGAEDFLRYEQTTQRLRMEKPLVADDTIDVVVSNCVLNLVASAQKEQLFREIHRVLRRGGRAVISDIVSDEAVPEAMQQDPELWSGCISGALTEHGFLGAFEEAGFYGVRIVERQAEPWRTVEGIEFRSLTVEAWKGKEGECWERNQAVIYRGPFKEVVDDDDHRMERGKRYAVCDKTFQIYRREPYRQYFEFIEPRVPIPLEEAEPFDCTLTGLRHPRETKGMDYDATTEGEACCTPGSGCC